MRLNDKCKKDLHDAWFMTGMGYAQQVQINKTTHVVIELESDDMSLNPATTIRVYKNGRFQKRYYASSENECIATIKRHK